MSTVFKNSDAALPALETAKILKFEREDWSLFRTLEGLQQKAGVPKAKLARLVLKELTDNALDESTEVRVAKYGSVFHVDDNGPGIDPDDVARLFSISRPMVSTKLLRLATRGALGNGLRVVAGAVLASEGSLTVTTRNRRIELRPERGGTTTVISNAPADRPIGTLVEIEFGPSLPTDSGTLRWARIAIRMSALGETYTGRSSPWWYDVPQFRELLYASGNRPVRELIATLDGCTGSKAGEIVAAAGLIRSLCGDVTQSQAARLLRVARDNARPVNPARLGYVGAEAFPDHAYACVRDTVGDIPVVVEAWSCEANTIKATRLTACVNRTPITGDIHASRDKRDIDAFGCGLSHTLAQAPKDKEFDIWLNITTPYMPITSDGKAPDLKPLLSLIKTVVSKAVRKARVPNSERVSQKSVVLEHLDAVIANVRGEELYRFNQRQLLYALRPIVMNELGEELTRGNFNAIITDFENENGEIEGMYREPRGSIYHPHRQETITLGDLMVADYERPAWTYNKVVYIEKEGFNEALKDNRWAERHDCMLMWSKGYTTRAARDLVDKIAEHDEPCTIFCVHDADAHGTTIYETFQEETRARGARKITIVNLGLEPWEAREMGLGVEVVDEKDRSKGVAEYVLEREDGDCWKEWLQTHRVELNAMTTPAFIAWLDRKMAEHGDGKLIPPPEILETELEAALEGQLRTSITERILRDAGFEAQVAAALGAIERASTLELTNGIYELFAREPDREWRDYIETVVKRMA